MADFFRSIDAVLLGRKTYDFATGQQEKPKRKTKKTKRKVAAGWGMKSYVFSRTLRLEPDDDLTIVSENAGEFVRELKNQPGKDIWLMGGGELARSLFAEGVIDEISLNIHPVLLGRGISLFPNLPRQINLELIAARSHKNGCVQVDYRVT